MKNCFWVLLALLALNLPAFAGGVGGYMASCSRGKDFEAGKVCQDVTSEVTGYAPGGHPIKVRARARAIYQDSQGNKIDVSLSVMVDDFDNYFDPEGMFPMVARTVICAGNRNACNYKVSSQSVLAYRRTGQRQFYVTIPVNEMQNNLGAGYVEVLEKLEVLLPGIGELLVIYF